MSGSDRIDWRARLAAHGVAGAAKAPRMFGAQLLISFGEHAAAEAALLEQLERGPDDEGTLRALSSLLETLGRDDEARALRRRCHALRARAMGISGEASEAAIEFFEAAERGGPPPARMPDANVAGLFDRYAPRFDEKLVHVLAYRGPQLVVAAGLAALPEGPLDVLDLGCGTGLAAPLLRPRARRLVGVDLSAGMLERARASGLYDELRHAELTAALAAEEARWDLITAVDVLIYFGDLAEVFARIAPRLRPGGVFAFSVEKDEEPGYHLRPTNRYTHHLDYLLATARAAGLRAVAREESTLRNEQGRPVAGHVLVLSVGA